MTAMKSIFIGGMAGSGKTAIALGLALKFRDQGLNVGYFKPLGASHGPHRQEDEDVILFQQVLSLPHDAATLSPVRTGPYYLSSGPRRDPAPLKEKLQQAYNTVSANVDVLLIDGSLSPYTAASLGLDAINLARMFDSTMLYVSRMEDDYSLDKTILYNELFRLAGIKVLGNIFNSVERTLLDKTKGVYAPILEEAGHPVLGIIPSRPEIASPTVREFYDALGGELLTEEGVGLERIVEEVVVGTMTTESALGYLRRAPNKAVITGGDRSDMAVTALETSTSVLILTGGYYPDVGVLASAIEKKVAVIMVHYDTFTAIERLHEITRRIHPGDEQGIRIAQTNISEHCNWQTILDEVKS
ncbi:DRTGG domain protein [Dethiobacter alkaliphilus AHT 1]|uniref:DRTGG domain protein n=2 Tax=Dethiobacter TaxID=427925 RepID=C0GKL9_DETAL|nr:DRTGG domain protein [Dethiobacter alkaliphilus AHT 1]